MATDARWIRLSVDIFDHPLFIGEVFSKRDAWLWLISNATRRRKSFALDKTRRVTLEVGEQLVARDYLAKKWHWTTHKVRSFLLRLEAEGAVLIKNYGRRMPLVITICKYREYQVPRTDSVPIENVYPPDSNQNLTKPEVSNPPSPQGGSETREEKFFTRAEKEARAAREVASMEKPKAEINPYRAQNHNYAPTGDPKKVGAGWTEDGTLQLFNGALDEALALSGSKEQLRIDLLVVQSSSRVGPSLNPTMLRSRALGVLAEVVDKRKQTDRRYAEACARGQKGRGASSEPSPQEVMASWAPTKDEAILRERFAWYVTKTKGGKDLLRQVGQEVTWKSFRDRQLQRVAEMAQ